MQRCEVRVRATPLYTKEPVEGVGRIPIQQVRVGPELHQRSFA